MELNEYMLRHSCSVISDALNCFLALALPKDVQDDMNALICKVDEYVSDGFTVKWIELENGDTTAIYDKPKI